MKKVWTVLLSILRPVNQLLMPAEIKLKKLLRLLTQYYGFAGLLSFFG